MSVTRPIPRRGNRRLSVVPEGRPEIPRPLEREVLVEAGHRCSIPTCRSVPVELAHIVPWSQVREHTFENLIALCPTCHSRYDLGTIDRMSMRQYKANLALLNSRYGDLERRLLEVLAAAPAGQIIQIPGGLDILLMYLLADGLLCKVSSAGGPAITIGTMPASAYYALTAQGRAFTDRWLAAQEL